MRSLSELHRGIDAEAISISRTNGLNPSDTQKTEFRLTFPVIGCTYFSS